jgi:putative ABC transport system permease protein
LAFPIDVSLIQLKPGINPDLAQGQLAAILPKDVKILTTQDFIEPERYYWENQGTIGFIFGLGIVVGFIVGKDEIRCNLLL